MNTIQAIALILMALSLGIAYGAYAQEKKLKADFVRIIKIRDLAHKEAITKITDDFRNEVNDWKRLVDSTMKNAYKIGVDDGRLM